MRTWYVADALGSVRRTVTDAGVPLGVVTYDPWGTVESGSVPTFGFTGELQDTTAGLVNLRARWYRTGQGRFTSVDPFAGAPESPYSLHQYAYGYSNPVVYGDPSGRICLDPLTAVLCSIATTAGAAGGSAGASAAAVGGAALLAPAAIVAAGAAIIAYPFTLDENAALNRQKFARGADFVLHGGHGYVWTDEPLRLNTANTEPPPPYQPLPGIEPQQPQRGAGIFAFPWAGPAACVTSGGFDLSPEQRALHLPFPLDPPQGPVVFKADLNQLPAGIKPSDLRGKRWETVERTLLQLGAVSLPPWPTYSNDKKYRWTDFQTGAIWEVRIHTERNTQFPDGPSGAGKYSIKFGRLVAAVEGYNGDTPLPDNVFTRLNAEVGVQLGDTVTQWIDRTGWLYYRYDDIPGGFFSNETHIPGAWNPFTFLGE